MSIHIGIDLGTTNSTVSVIQLKSHRDDPIAALMTCPIYQYGDTIDKYEMDTITLPSSIYFDIEKKQVYTGIYAKKMYASGDRPMETVRSTKTRIGGESMIEVPKIGNSGETMFFDMTQCASLLVKTVLQALKQQFPNENVEEEVAVTVPAAFNSDERQATINACLLAGFKKCHILDEPTAALLYYINGGNSQLDQWKVQGDGEYKLVYDIGGGTLDVCIAKILENHEGDVEIHVVARSKRMNLGGDDFDQALAAYFLSDFEKVRKPIEDRSAQDQNRIIARLVSKAEDYKIEMNDAIKARLDDPRKLEKIKKYPAFELIDEMFIDGITLTKGLFDELFAPLCNKTNGIILAPVYKCLEDAGLRNRDISEVVITGGMSNFYAIEESLRAFFTGDVTIVQIDSISSVSKGAAIHHYGIRGGEKLKKLIINDRMAENIYIKEHGKFKLFIPCDTNAKKGTYEYEIRNMLMAEIPIFLYAGTGDDPETYTPLSGEFLKLDVPIEKGDKIHLYWSMDDDKVIRIDVKELEESINISGNKNYSSQEIQTNPIQQYKVNRG